MKYLKKINSFLNEAKQIDPYDVPFTDANGFSMDTIREVNNMYNEILPHIDEILEKHDIFPSSVFFFNGYFAHDYKERDADFFNNLIKKGNKEVAMIKGIMVTDLNREKILNLIDEPSDTFNYVIERIRDEDVNNILTEDKLKIFEDTKKGQLINFCFCPFYSYKPIKIDDIWKKGNDYSIRFTLDIKDEMQNLDI